MPVQAGRRSPDLGYEIFIALLSILSVFNMFVVIIPRMDPDAIGVVYTVNEVLILIFLFDFCFRLYGAESRRFYFFRDYGWADLLACAPVLRFLRLFRIVKAYRLVHTYGARYLIDFLSRNRAEAALYILVFAVVMIIQTGSFLVLIAESVSPEANIRTANDAMWWVYTTITTVGYGDRYPVTDMGRLIGMLVMTTGVGVFATFAGYIANKLLVPRELEGGAEQGYRSSSPAAATLAELREYLAEKERIDDEISTRLIRLEHLIQGEDGPPDAGPSA